MPISLRAAVRLSFAFLSGPAAFAQLPGFAGFPVAVGDQPANVPDRPLTCRVNSNPQTVRAEGFAELLGDIEIVCRGFFRPNPRNAMLDVTPTPLLETFNLSVTLSVPFTSRLIADPVTEALLFIDDPPAAPTPAAPIFQNPCAGPGGVCGPFYAHDGIETGNSADDRYGTAATLTPTAGLDVITGPRLNSASLPVNVFAGARQNAHTVVFSGIPLSSFDTRRNRRLAARYYEIKFGNGGFYRGEEILVPFEKRFRIKNLRGSMPGAAAVGGQVFAFLSVQNTSARLQLNQASPVVGFVQPGFTFRQRNVTDTGTNPTVTFAACVTVNRDLAVDVTDADPFAGHFLVEFAEGYAAAFRARGFVAGGPDQNDPKQNYDTESGFYNQLFPSALNLNRAGIADSGTRLRLAFRNVPANVRVFASVAGVSGTSPTLGAYGVVAESPVPVPVFPTALPAGLTSGGAAAPSAQGIALVSGAMTWEVYAASSSQTERILFLVAAAYRAANGPGLGTVTMQGTLAPRFVETGALQTAFSIGPCLTNLLFPFVTNQAGFNTGIAISNTSLSNPGAGELLPVDANNGVSPQNGACMLNYFGTTGADGAAPPPAATGVIPAGRTFTMTLASGTTGTLGNVPAAPNFQGYVIAQCSFRFAHGYAFISDMGAAQLAHGYVALVMDTNANRTGNVSESLGQ